MVCAGCGVELPPGTGRGRRARFHNATCRQRAHRARVASRHGEVLDALHVVESAVVELRRVVLAEEAAPTEAGRRLEQAAQELVRRLDEVSAAQAATPTTATPRVTKPVTVSESTPPAGSLRPGQSTASPDTFVTKKVTKQRQAKSGPSSERRSTARSSRLDLETVRLERISDPASPGWRVLAGEESDPVILGFLKPAYSANGHRNGRWQARTAHHLALPGGPWRNRTDAVVRLVDSYQRARASR